MLKISEMSTRQRNAMEREKERARQSEDDTKKFMSYLDYAKRYTKPEKENIVKCFRANLKTMGVHL